MPALGKLSRIFNFISLSMAPIYSAPSSFINVLASCDLPLSIASNGLIVHHQNYDHLYSRGSPVVPFGNLLFSK
jgi:hypothetical protein